MLAQDFREDARIMTSPEAKQFLNIRGNEVAEDTSREAYAAYIKKDSEKFRQLIEMTGFKRE